VLEGVSDLLTRILLPVARPGTRDSMPDVCWSLRCVQLFIDLHVLHTLSTTLCYMPCMTVSLTCMVSTVTTGFISGRCSSENGL